MRELVLFRHARAEQYCNDGDDHERPATTDGLDEAMKIAGELVRAGACPDIVLVSTARRCSGTWEHVASLFPEAQASHRRELYLASPADIKRLAEATGGNAVMIVGHNPGLKQLVAGLASGGEDCRKQTLRFPPAAAAMFTRTDDAAAFSIRELLVP